MLWSPTAWIVIVWRLSSSAVWYYNSVSALSSPFLLSSSTVISINSVELRRSKLPAQSSGTLDPPVEGSRLSPTSWLPTGQCKDVSPVISAGWDGFFLESFKILQKKTPISWTERKRKDLCILSLPHSPYMADCLIWSLLQRLVWIPTTGKVSEEAFVIPLC